MSRRPFIVASLLLCACHCGPTIRRAPTGECLPREGGEVRIALAALPNTLDWNTSSQASAENYPVIQAMMRGLTELDDSAMPRPALAESWEVKTTADVPPKQVYTFHLRRDVVWSDGHTPLTAHDFVFGWRRSILGNEPAEMLDIDGAQTVLDARDGHGDLKQALEHFGVHAIDEHTLEVMLRSPRSYFLSRLANVYPYFPAPSVDLEGRGDEEQKRYFASPASGKPMVLGAFQVKSWDRLGRTVRLVANPHDREAPPSGRVEKLLLMEAALSPILYDQCQIDFVLLDDPTTLASAPPDTQRSELLSTYFLGINTSLVPLATRRAIAAEIDRSTLFSGLLPTARLATSYLPPGMPGARGSGGHGGAPAADGAAGELTLLVRNSKTFLPERGVAEGLRRQLGANGISVRVIETSNFANDIQDADGKVRHSLFLKRVGADYAHPQTMFTPFQADGVNYTEWQHLNGGADLMRFQGLLDAGAAATDLAGMTAAYAAADRLLTEEDVILVPLYYPDRYYRKRPWIEGLGIDPFNFLTLRSLRLRPMPPP